jgi:hypothetical protein
MTESQSLPWLAVIDSAWTRYIEVVTVREVLGRFAAPGVHAEGTAT